MTIQLVDSNRELKTCISRLSQNSEIALDLEFDKNFHRYGFNVCLVQMYADHTCYLIDPLSDELEIKHIFPILEDPMIQKVVFAFGEDLRLLHSLGCFPKNIYDLNIATSLLNYQPASLTNYVETILKTDTGNSSQQSNWYRRPLSDSQKKYAAEDVLHLKKLKKILEKEAEKAGISHWIAEENQAFNELDYTDVDDNVVIRQKDKKGLNEVEWHTLKKLLIFRDELAEKYDKPHFKIIKKDFLVDVVKNPSRLSAWDNVRGIFKKVKTREVKERIAELLKEGREEAKKLNLSETEPADKPLSKDEYALQNKKRQELQQLKAQLLDPIKTEITKDFGAETASFMLSNRIMSELIAGEYGVLEDYKRKLFLTYAKDLDLNIDRLTKIVDPENG